MICIVIGTYNRAHLLSRSLYAYSNHLTKDDKIIVLDDDSEDDTEELCKSYAGLVHYIKLPAKNGKWRDSASFLNKGISIALNEWGATHVFVTHPEIIVGKDTIGEAVRLSDKNTWISAKGYYLSIAQQRSIDNVAWEVDLLNVRNLPEFYNTQSAEFQGREEYTPAAIEKCNVWHSWIFGGGSAAMWRYFGGLTEFETWGSVDVDLNDRRRILGMNTVTPKGESAIVVHQNHDDPDNNTITPRDMDKCLCALTTYTEHTARKPELIKMDIYSKLDLLPAKLHGFNYYRSPLFKELITELKPRTIIEVGTWLGGSAFTMCDAIKEQGLKTKLYCVDTWLGSLEFIDETQGCLRDAQLRAERDLMMKNGYPNIYYQFLSNVVHTGNDRIIMPIPNTSDIASRYFRNNNIRAELTYIDGSHDEPDVYRDLENYYDLTSHVIFGDDYGWAGVHAAVNRFCKERGLKFDVKENNFWIIRK